MLTKLLTNLIGAESPASVVRGRRKNLCHIAIQRHERTSGETEPYDHFDRQIIAQAIAENIPIVTGDEAFEKYPVKVIW